MRAPFLRRSFPAWAPLLTRCGFVKGPCAGPTVFGSYFFPLVNPPTKPQKIRTTWLAGAQPSYGPLLQRTGFAGGISTYQSGAAAWNEWFFSETYLPLFRYGLSFQPATYAYVVESAFLSFPFAYLIIGAPLNYDWDIGYATAEFGVSGNTIVYLYTVEDATLTPGHSFGTLRGPILTTSTRVVQGPKRVSEVVAPAFDFTAKTVVGDTLSSPAVTVSVWSGVDPNPQLVYGGSSTINGLVINPVLTGGVAGVIYQVKVTVNSLLAGILTLDSFLVVLPDSL